MKEDLDFLDKPSVLVIGDVMLDRYIWGDVQRISPEAPVPIIAIRRETFTAGGAGNLALNLGALGVRCELFGIVGNDNKGVMLRDLFSERGVKFEPALLQDGTPTITKTRVIAQRQQICRLDDEASPDRYSIPQGDLSDLLVEKLKVHDVIILSDYAKGVVTQSVIDMVRAAKRRRQCFVALDPKPSRSLEITNLDLLTPNRAEALQLLGLRSGHHSLSDNEVADRIMAQFNPEVLVVTLGEHGMLLRTRSQLSSTFATVAKQVADVSGAGDTVVAILAVALGAGLSPARAVEMANAAAGIVVSKLGTATLTRTELAQAIDAVAPH